MFSKQIGFLTFMLWLAIPCTAFAQPPDWLDVSPGQVYQAPGSPSCYTVTVGDGANMTIDVAFTYEGGGPVRRVEALGKFLDSDDGKNLLAGYKRATNIIRIEEKKDKREYTGAPDAKLYRLAEEKALAEIINVAKNDASAAVAKEDFAAAMSAMAKLRPTVDAFFDKVTVNVDDKALRENRLKLLNEIREATRAVADFSKIEG